MANYYGKVRTNYFHVKDAEKFKALMQRVVGTEDIVRVFEEKDTAGMPVFGFGCLSTIAGIPFDDHEGNDDEYSYDAFVDGLQECVADDDAILIMEAGNEKLRYVIGSCLILTSKSHKYLEIASVGKEEARKMLGNSQWDTRTDY